MSWDATTSLSPNRPQRARKRNRLIYYGEDNSSVEEAKQRRKTTLIDAEADLPPSNGRIEVHDVKVKEEKGSTQAGTSATLPDKTIAKRIGFRLKNLLKLPKAHKMCIYEWFYSHIDKALFDGDNDFLMCLKESFPDLPNKDSLTRAHWSKIRRLMGKPRRCSEAFFAEERNSLKNKREKIRILQQRKNNSDSGLTYTDLPREIPMSLILGTRVTARLRGPYDGLFTGQIDAVNIQNSSYRVTFDRSNLGTQEIQDIEVASDEPQETMQLSSLTEPKRVPHMFSSPIKQEFNDTLRSPSNYDPVLGQSPLRSKLPGGPGGTLGGFPIQFLVQVARLSKILAIKKENLRVLQQMNSQAEKWHSYGEVLPLEFQRKYATIVLDFERLNADLNSLLVGIQQFCLEISPESTMSYDQVSHIRQQALRNAEQMVEEKNVATNGKSAVNNSSLTSLVKQLLGVMMQVKYLKENNSTSFEFKAISDSMSSIKSKLTPENLECFENNVEIHIAHVQSGMKQGNRW